ncbi:MAG: hypothetical protein KGI27_02740 [Thaumarchaeota archaeon]|nr:hypothetical protein [Nitrososphaerota archaeon]
MKNKKIIIPIVITLSLIATSTFMITPASAHVEKSFGDVSVKVGLSNEPPLVGDTNQVQIIVTKGSGSNAQPLVDTALDNVTTTIKYGGITKTLSPVPSDDNPGEYDSTIIPTQLGSYYIILTGNIDGQAIDNGTFPLDQVESKDNYYFPPLGSSTGLNDNQPVQGGTSGTPYGMPAPQFSAIVNQLANDINDAKNLANSTNQNMLTIQQSYQNLKSVTDELFIVAGIGIGTGIAGIVIAVYALNRRNGSHQV